ncbi:MAG: LysM peptidoglycan-binding domain-containing protein, partial [Candidatus Binataceae bacterium]
DGLPRKINMLCHSAMLAAYTAGERKVSLRTAKMTAAEYHDAVRITNRGIGARLLRATPALIVGAALASLLLLGVVYPNVWSDWTRNNTVSFGRTIGQTIRPVEPVKQAKTVGQVRPVIQSGPVVQPGLEGHPGSGAKPRDAASLAPHPVEMRASLAPGATVPAASKSNVAGPPTASETRMVPTTPAAAAVSAAIQKQTAVSAGPEQRSQITVKYGDTFEKIAIRYLGSKSGINNLIDANTQLTNINQLSVGEIVYLPPGVTPKALQDQGATTPPVPNTEDSPER